MEIYFAIFLYFILPTNGGASFIYDDARSRGKIVDAIFPSFNGMTFAGVNVTLCVYDNSCDGFLICIEREPNTRTNRVNQTSNFFSCPNLEQYSAIYFKTKYTSNWIRKDKMAVELYMPSLKNEQGQITSDIPLKFDLYEKLNYKITNEYEGYCVYFTLKDGDGGNVIKKAYNGEDLVKFDHDEALRISYSSSNTGRAINIKYFTEGNCGLRLSVSSSNEPICQTFNSHQYQCPKGKIDEKIHLCKNKLETTGEYKLQMKDKRGIWSPEEIVPDIPNYISSAMAQTLLERLGKNHRNVYNDAMGSLGFPRNRELFLVEFRHFAHQMTVTQIDVECVVLFKYRYTVNTGVLYIEAGDFNDYFFIA